ncbi:MAG TPA: type II toxin-antitoxin system PemK/MazF family toxin [Candidatus Eisenbacteria bacterium]|nr:type II toxin-antitoxin system PemK/MazF family toxin [Candidatus Eisenbacteria bacterium]
MRRGSVYWINLEPASPPELGKVRPAIVVSNTVHNERLDSVVVVPLSSRAPEIWPLRLEIQIRGLRESYAVVPGIRQVSKARLHELAAQAPGIAIKRLEAALAAYLGD